MSIATLILLLTFPLAGISATYSLADLEILSTEGSHEEFFKHALDVRPSERQESWKAMVSKMADAFTQSLVSKSELTSKDFGKMEALYKWPVLKTDDIFKVRRVDLGLKYLKKCLRNAEPCFSETKAFWEADPTDPELAIKFAEILKDVPNSPIATWTFLDVALKTPLSEFYCKKDFVMDALWDKIGIDYIRLGPQGDLTVKIDQTIHPDCLPSLIKTARSRLYFPKRDTDRELGYQILKSQSKVDQTLSDFFYVVYLLERPSQGELFNLSWNKLKELGNAPLRRDNVMEEMKKLDPLPDNLLSSMDQTKKRVVLQHFKSYFPEYLSFYTDQCVLFYGGKGSFPKGNPTVNCQDFMSSEMAPQIFDSYKIKQYQDVKKI